jgi:hypothetical protein
MAGRPYLNWTLVLNLAFAAVMCGSLASEFVRRGELNADEPALLLVPGTWIAIAWLSRPSPRVLLAAFVSSALYFVILLTGLWLYYSNSGSDMRGLFVLAPLAVYAVLGLAFLIGVIIWRVARNAMNQS